MINTPILFRRDINYSTFLNRIYPEIFSPNIDADTNSPTIKCKTITLQITNDCNLKCSYCYQHNKKHDYMTFEIAKKFIDQLLDNKYSNYRIDTKESPGVIFEFIGGEPFLHVNLITQICDYIEEQLIELEHPWLLYHRYGISSNGTLYFTDEVQDFLKKYGHLLSLNITVDGNQELHDTCRLFHDGSPSYHIAHKAALDWKKRSGEESSKITFAPANISFLSEAIIDFMKDGFTSIFANCVFEEGWTNEHATIYYKELKKLANYLLDNNLVNDYYISLFEHNNFHPLREEINNNWCGGDGSMLSIDPNGELYPCIRYMKSSLGDSQKPLIIGHVDSSIGGTELYENNLKTISNVTRRSQSTDECFYCPIAKGCAWCSGYNYEKFGTLHKRATYICCMHKARSLANVYYWNSFFKKNNIPAYMPLHCPKDWALDIIDENEYNYLLNLTQHKEDAIDVSNS